MVENLSDRALLIRKRAGLVRGCGCCALDHDGSLYYICRRHTRKSDEAIDVDHEYRTPLDRIMMIRSGEFW